MPKQPLKVDAYNLLVEILSSQVDGKVIVSLRDVLLCLVRELPLLGFDVNDCPDKLQKEIVIILTKYMIIKEIDLVSALLAIPDNIAKELSEELDTLKMASILNKPECIDWLLANLNLMEAVLMTMVEFAASFSVSPTKKIFFVGALKELSAIDLIDLAQSKTLEEIKAAIQEKKLVIDMSE